jgi:hypothetical protein
MDKQIYIAQFTNGIAHRSIVVLQPDIIFAAMEAQRQAPDAFRKPWNQVSDQSKWKIVIIATDGQKYEEPARVN